MNRHPNYKKDVSSQEIKVLRQKGWPLAKIGKQVGIAPETVRDRLAESGFAIQRRCALPDCERVFSTRDARKVFCCLRHAKLASDRTRHGRVFESRECLMPGCSKKVLGVRGYTVYCCREHGERNARLWRKGVFKRLLSKFPKCLACGEYAVVDKHHVRFAKNKSDKSSQVVYVCPTHHMLIHKGLARISPEGSYERLDGFIADDLRRKQPNRCS